jgi:hypothetical protein
MTARVLYCAPLVWTGLTTSKLCCTGAGSSLTFLCSIKEQLRNRELSIAGDHWPIFLYHGYGYDKEDPWNGLFRSAILVKVRIFLVRVMPPLIVKS